MIATLPSVNRGHLWLEHSQMQSVRRELPPSSRRSPSPNSVRLRSRKHLSCNGRRLTENQVLIVGAEAIHPHVFGKAGLIEFIQRDPVDAGNALAQFRQYFSRNFQAKNRPRVEIANHVPNAGAILVKNSILHQSSIGASISGKYSPRVRRREQTFSANSASPAIIAIFASVTFIQMFLNRLQCYEIFKRKQVTVSFAPTNLD